MRLRTFKFGIITLFVIGISFGVSYSYRNGPPDARSGVPAGGGFEAEPTCVGCHVDFPLNPDEEGKIKLIGVPDNYIPGQRYSLMFQITHPVPDRVRWGFQTTAISRVTYEGVGTFVVTDQRRTKIIMGGPEGSNRQYIEHGGVGAEATGQRGSWWEFDWIAPGTNIGEVDFYGSGNAAGFPKGNSQGDKIYNTTPEPLATTKGQYVFVDVAAEANVAAGGGRAVAVGDFDNDGWEDVLVVTDDQLFLYRNTRDGMFADVTASAGIAAGGAPGRAAAWGDFDGDGDLDLYLVRAGADVLYRNDGYRNDGEETFTDVTSQAGISGDAVGRAAAWGDFDGDGQADLYVANEGQDVLYRNEMDGTFSQVDPATAGLTESASSWDVALADYDDDGRLDIFVANDGQDALYRNNGDGTFTELAAMVGIETANVLGLAAGWADDDGDGDEDLFIANMGVDLLYRNNGDGTLTEVAVTAGIVEEAVSVAAAWADYDGDGDPDLFVASEGQDFLYRNNGDGTFNEVAIYSGMTDMAIGGGAAWLEVGNDGYPDLFVANAGDENFLYLNPGRSGAPPEDMAQQGNSRGGDYRGSLVTWLTDRLLR